MQQIYRIFLNLLSTRKSTQNNIIVYNDIKRQFVNDVKDNSIADKILEAIRIRGLIAGHEKEYSSWQNSMQFMRNIVDDSEIDDEVRICIEYNIPLTSKRVDFIIAGADKSGKDNIIIVELKQWHYIYKTFCHKNT